MRLRTDTNDTGETSEATEATEASETSETSGEPGERQTVDGTAGVSLETVSSRRGGGTTAVRRARGTSMMKDAAASQSGEGRRTNQASMSQAGIEAVMSLAQIRPSDTVFDLGCGDGRLLTEAIRRGASWAVGIEIDDAMVAKAQSRVIDLGLKDRIRIHHGDVKDEDISSANVVLLNLCPSRVVGLEQKLLRELVPGTRVVSLSFDLMSAAPTAAIRTADCFAYQWIIGTEGPARGLVSPPKVTYQSRVSTLVVEGVPDLKQVGAFPPGVQTYGVRIRNEGRLTVSALTVAWRFVDCAGQFGSCLQWQTRCVGAGGDSLLAPGASIIFYSESVAVFCISRSREAAWRSCTVELEDARCGQEP